MAPDHGQQSSMTIIDGPTIWREKKSSTNEIHSVAGTEQQSIAEKISWSQMKGLYDLVMQQKDEASSTKRSQPNIIVDASRFGSIAETMSDLSDNTSRDANAEDRLATRSEPQHTGRVYSGHNTTSFVQPSRRTDERKPNIQSVSTTENAHVRTPTIDSETEYINSICSASGNLSVSALEGLVDYLSQALQLKIKEEQQGQEQPVMSTSAEEQERRLRTNSSSSPGVPPQRNNKTTTAYSGSNNQLSQSAPSLLFTSQSKHKFLSAPLVGQSNRNISSKNSSGSGLNSSHISFDDEDEEVLQLVSSENEKGGMQQPQGHGTPHSYRGMSTPSPKHKRVNNNTPSKTPPIRPGAIPPMAAIISRDSSDLEPNSVAYASTSYSAAGAVAATSSTTKSGKNREQSPPNISRRPAAETSAAPVGLRKVNRKDTSSLSSIGSSVSGSGDFRVYASTTENSSRKQKRAVSAGISVEAQREVDCNRNSLARLSELHMSPRSAFDDRSVNSNISSSSASHSNYQ